MFAQNLRLAAGIMRQRKPSTLGGILECALADGHDEDAAWAIVDAHYKNLSNDDYRAAAGLQRPQGEE